MDLKTAVEAMQRRHATLDAVGSGVAVKPNGDPNRKRIVDEIKKFLAKKSLMSIDTRHNSGQPHLPHLPGIDKCLKYRHSDNSKEPNHGISESREAWRDHRAG
jgi:hypothetical protein